MDTLPDLHAGLRAEAARELTGHILPYWAEHAVDRTHGGFIGQIAGDNVARPGAPKGAVLNARILWTFAAAARALNDTRCRALADRAYTYLVDRFWDREYGGVFWMLDYAGAPLEPKKQTYAQGFACYALAEYHRLTGDAAALERAVALFELLEQHAAEPVHGGYWEGFDRFWRRLEDPRLSDKDLPAPKSMNTHLHVLEAYTTLYRVWPSPRLKERLTTLIRLFLDTILDPRTHHARCFFDERWTVVSDVISYGHDIETSWLLAEAADAVEEPALRADVQAEAVRMAEATLAEGVDEDGGLLNETGADGLTDDDKHWWPQAEAVVGFVNAFQLTRDERFLRAARKTWTFIQRTIVDAEHGEWFFRVSRSGVPYHEEDKVGPWKCPYHNARACLELLHRLDAPASAERPTHLREGRSPRAGQGG